MNTNRSQSNLKDFTKSVAYNLQDEILAMHLQLFVERVVRVLLWVYVAVMVSSEKAQPVLVSVMDALHYIKEQALSIAQLGRYWSTSLVLLGDGKQSVLTQTIKDEVLS